MKNVVLTTILLIVSTATNAHSGENPALQLEKKRSYILQYQKEYQTTATQEEKIANLHKQLRTLQSTIVLLRSSLASENSSFVGNRDEFGLNYFAALSDSLKDTRQLLKQLEDVMD